MSTMLPTEYRNRSYFQFTMGYSSFCGVDFDFDTACGAAASAVPAWSGMMRSREDGDLIRLKKCTVSTSRRLDGGGCCGGLAEVIEACDGGGWGEQAMEAAGTGGRNPNLALAVQLVLLP